MGLDLVLLPFDGREYSHTVLDCERNNELFQEILELQKKKGRDVPEYFGTYLCRDEKYS